MIIGEITNVTLIWVVVVGLMVGIGYGFLGLVMTGYRERGEGRYEDELF